MQKTLKQPTGFWLCTLCTLLLITLFPVISTWFSVVSRLSFQTSGLQWITLGVLGVVLYQHRQQMLFSLNGSLNSSIIGLGAFGIAVLIYLAAAILHIYTLFWASGLLLLATGLWALSGLQVLHQRLGWFIFALFLLPQMPLDLHTSISVSLQMFSTQITATLAGLLIPITHSGNIFFINAEAFEVTVACSGLNTWIGFLFAGFLWLVFEAFSFKRVAFIASSALAFALLTNTLRLLITALVAYYQSADSAIAIHTNLEYVLLPLGLVAMAWTGRKCGM